MSTRFFIAVTMLLMWPPYSRAQAQQQSGVQSVRPSFSVIVLDAGLSGKFSLEEVDLGNTSVGQRADIDIVRRISASSVRLSSGAFFDDERSAEVTGAIRSWLESSGFGREVVASLYEVDGSFRWSLEKLRRRAVYGQTIVQAVETVASVRGGINSAADQANELVTRAHILVVVPRTVVKTTRDDKGRQYTSEMTDVQSFLFKIGYDSRESVFAALEPFFCDGCPDVGNRRQAFQSLRVPVQWVTDRTRDLLLTLDAPGTNESERVISTAFLSLLARSEGLQTRMAIASVGPIRAPIGTKEGAAVRRRYRVVRRHLRQDGTIVEKARGWVRAVEVVDNRAGAVAVGPGGQERVRQFAPSVFQQVHGRKLEAMDVLIERPDKGIDVMAGIAQGEFVSVDIQATSHFGTITKFGGIEISNFSDDSAWEAFDIVRLGVLFGYEAFPLRGNVRLFPTIAFGAAAGSPVEKASSVKSVQALYAKVAGNASLQFTEQVGLFGGMSWSMMSGAKLVGKDGSETEFTWSDSFQSGEGIQFRAGVRYAF